MREFMLGFQILYNYHPYGGMCSDEGEIFVGGPPPSELTEGERQVLKENKWVWVPKDLHWLKSVAD